MQRKLSSFAKPKKEIITRKEAEKKKLIYFLGI